MKLLTLGCFPLLICVGFQGLEEYKGIEHSLNSILLTSNSSELSDTLRLDWREFFDKNSLSESTRTYDIILDGNVKGRMVFEKFRKDDQWVIRDTSELYGQIWETLTVDFDPNSLRSKAGAIVLKAGENELEGKLEYKNDYVSADYTINEGQRRRISSITKANGLVRPLIFALPEAFDLEEGAIFPIELFAFSSGELWDTELIVQGQETLDWYGQHITTWKLYLKGGKVENYLYISVEDNPRLLQVDVLGQNLEIVLQPEIDYSQFYNGRGQYYNINQAGVGLDGYDPVAYHQESAAEKGSELHQTAYDGVVYWFKNADNKTLFEKSPETFLPAYGGYCAYGLGMKETPEGYKPGKYPINPESFQFIEGRLYLFYHTSDFNALEYWNANKEDLRKRADQNWLKIGRRK